MRARPMRDTHSTTPPVPEPAPKRKENQENAALIDFSQALNGHGRKISKEGSTAYEKLLEEYSSLHRGIGNAYTRDSNP
jgi:hypothetical protein